MIKNIKITLTDGSRYSLRSSEEQENVDPQRECIFLFDNGQVFKGCTDGQVDEDGDFCVKRPDKAHAIGLPFDRLIGWAYKHRK